MEIVLAYILAFVAALPVWLAIALKVGVVVGLVGSLIEEIGKRFNLPRVVAVGQQIEAVAVDVPKLVSRVQALDIPGLVRKALALFGKAPLVLLLCLGLVVAPSSCTNVKPALTSAQVPKDVALAFKAAGVALAIADTAAAAYADSIENPTQRQVKDVAAIVARLSAVKKALDEVQADLGSGRDKLRAVLSELRDAEKLFALAGVRVPSALDRALDETGKVLQ